MKNILKYKEHVLICINNDSEIYLCANCKIRLFSESEYSFYEYIERIGFISHWEVFDKTCDEQIIKNIIE